MDVKEIMSEQVKSCAPESSLGEIAQLMWSENIGCVPIVDGDGKPLGIVTDRDIAMSAYLNHKSLWEIQAREVVNGKKLWICQTNDPITKAIELMKNHEIRRLPVIDKSGHLKGLLSLGDMISAAEPASGRSKGELSFNDLAPAFKACFAHHLLAHAHA